MYQGQGAKNKRKSHLWLFQDKEEGAASEYSRSSRAEEKQNTMKIDTVNKVIKVYNTREYEEAKDFLADEINQATNINGWKIEYDTGEEE